MSVFNLDYFRISLKFRKKTKINMNKYRKINDKLFLIFCTQLRN